MKKSVNFVRRLIPTGVVGAIVLCLAMGEAPARAEEPGNLAPGRFAVDMASHLPQHDVVYLAPAAAPDEGLPLGNGDLSAVSNITLPRTRCHCWRPPPKSRHLSPPRFVV